jgi:predicted RNA-binding Zn-ribbon protein involved in translation (DUF1610 family)
MRTPSAAQLLDVWESALSQSPTRRALSLLATAHPDLAESELAALSIGRRDGRLLQLRKRLFGTQLQLVMPCPQCGQFIESQLRVDDLARDYSDSEAATYVAESHDHRISFRLPASGDLMALPDDGDAAESRARLIERCVLEVRDAFGEQKAVSSLPDEVVDEIVMHMQAADPGVDLQLAFECPACGHHWQEMLDIASFLWREIHAWAQRTVREVDALARAYGWHEADVLSLSPTRRQIYLELCRR